MQRMATSNATSSYLLPRCWVYGVALVCVWQPINVLRHAANLPNHIVVHFDIDNNGAQVELPFWLFSAAVIFGTLMLGAAVVGIADVSARRRESRRWTWNAQLRAERVGDCAATAQFWLGVLVLLWVDLVVWAVLEANEEVPVNLPPAGDCIPCAVFIPLYRASVAGRRWLWTLLGLGGGWMVLLALPWLAGRRRANDTVDDQERVPIMLPYEEF
jgi:hypothetical protein